MNKEALAQRIENVDFREEICGFGGLEIKVSRNSSGRIINIRPSVDSNEADFTEIGGRLIFESETGGIVVERDPPPALQRDRSGHLPIPIARQCWVVDFVHGDEALTTSLPVVEIKDGSAVRFTAQEDKRTKSQVFLPFSMTVNHPDLFAPKTDIVSLLQIFGHAPAAVRMLQTMPEPLRLKTFLAAKNTDNVPKTMVDARNSITGLSGDFLVPLVYDDGTSGGPNLFDRKVAVWWLVQNPELVDQVMHSRVIISDFREEVAILKQIADSHDLPQVFLGLTYLWPQRLNELQVLHPELQRAKSQLATQDEKLRSMAEVGLGKQDAVVDWFSRAREWKAGVRDGNANAVDLIISFGLVSPFTRPPDVDNCIVLPPRTKLENLSEDSLWTNNMRRILVTIGSGDWTERELFVQNLIQATTFLPNCEFIIVGNNGIFQEEMQIPDNVRLLGTVEPHIVDGLIATCDLAVIKPGHFSLEETSGKLTLVAGPDNIKRAVEISKRAGTPRAVAIAVEVDEERLTNAIELWCAMGSPDDFAPLVDISTPEKIASKIRESLEESVLSEKLTSIPRGGTSELVNIIDTILGTTFARTGLNDVIQRIKNESLSIWNENL